ncbi:hypothetical protein HY633_00745 [Candidatus Uhrbacteria bacterium]|nr:hypothetical protein [Candidatus Uhrbacteria bacterium]
MALRSKESSSERMENAMAAGRKLLDEMIAKIAADETGGFVIKKSAADEMFDALRTRAKAARTPQELAILKNELHDLWRTSVGPTAEAAARMLDDIEDDGVDERAAGARTHRLLRKENVSFDGGMVVIALDRLHALDDLRRALRRLVVDALPPEAFEEKTPGALDPDEAAAVLETVMYLDTLFAKGKAPGVTPAQFAFVAERGLDYSQIVIKDLEKFEELVRSIHAFCARRRATPETLAKIDNVPAEEWDDLTARGGAHPLKRLVGHENPRIREAERLSFMTYIKEKLYFFGGRLKAVRAHSERRGTVLVDGHTFGINATNGFVETMDGRRLPEPVNLNERRGEMHPKARIDKLLAEAPL